MEQEEPDPERQPAHPAVVIACQKVERRLPALAATIVDDLKQREAPYASLPSDELAATVIGNIAGLVESVRLNQVQDLAGPRHTGRVRAQQDIALPTVLSGYRLGVMHVWRELVGACGAVDAADPDRRGSASRALLDSASVLWTAFDLHAQELAAEYRSYQAEQLEQDRMRRDALLASLLSGEPGSESLTNVAERLHVPVTGPYVVIAANPGAMGLDGGSVRGQGPLGFAGAWRSSGDIDLALVALPAPDDISVVVARAAGRSWGRVGIGRHVTSLKDVPRSVDQARRARIAAPPGREVVATFDEVHVANVVASAPQAAAELERVVLTGLSARSPQEQDLLLRTFATWITSGGSAVVAGQALHCHPNTVRYRLAKLAEATGRDLKDPIDVVHLHLAAETRRLRTDRPG